jgi:hypothetical protein
MQRREEYKQLLKLLFYTYNIWFTHNNRKAYKEKKLKQDKYKDFIKNYKQRNY